MIAIISNIKGTELSPDLLRRNNINPEQIITIVIKTEIGVAEEQQKTQRVCLHAIAIDHGL